MSIIKVEKISKQYEFDEQSGRYLALRDVMANTIKNPIKFLQGKGNRKKSFLALDDISFTLNSGEVLGLIGPNGAGKSTLLKILSRITPPTSGRISIRGKVASLLEVGTGFHPELTGRENIYMNGALLGMAKSEIKNKIEEIIKFSGVSKFVDMPVKKYSSGMYVRLAFSVAAHLEPDILLVDEVLAVGDMEFQKKCLGKMDEVVKKSGRTIIFVSHNMSAIRNLCNRCILLESGKISADGETDEVVDDYIFSCKNNVVSEKNNYIMDNEYVRIHKLDMRADDSSFLQGGTGATIEIKADFLQEIERPGLVLSIKTDTGIEISRFSTLPISGFNIDRLKGERVIKLKINKLPLTGGRYRLAFGLTMPNIKSLVKLHDIHTFDVEPSDYYGSGHYMNNQKGYLFMDHKWDLH